MNFLAPWFLLGAVAVAGPVLFHLIRRSARERMPFSSLLFLRPTPPRATRRRKLEHILLLLLRCLAVVLLAAGFARPFFPGSDASQPPAAEARQTVVLLDTSASMHRQGLWPKARAVAARYFAKAAVSDRVAVLTFDQQLHTLISFTEWSSWPLDQRTALAKQRLEAVSPGWGGTQLGVALTSAVEEFQDSAGATGAREVILVSDMQEGAKLDGLQGHDWPKGVRVVLERVDPDRRGNAGLGILDASLGNAGNGRQPRVRVVNSRDSDREKFQLGWRQEEGTRLAGTPTPIYLPPGQTRTLVAPELPAGALTGELRLSGDDEDFGDAAYFAAPEPEQSVVAYFGSESVNDAGQLRYYIERAFSETPNRRVEVAAVTNSVSARESLNRASFAVVPASLSPDEAADLREWIGGGKTALLVLTNAQSGATLAALTGETAIEISEAGGDYALIGEADFTHPIFAPFADPRFSDFSRIHFWKHRRWTVPPNLQARALAKFDDGSPALALISIGNGNLLVLSAGWNPADSQLAVSSKFVPLMWTILDWSGGVTSARAQFQIGEPIPSPVRAAVLGVVKPREGGPTQDSFWRKPDGKIVTLAADAPFTQTDIPGIYTVSFGARTLPFAVNLPLDECRTAPMSSDDLARLGVPLQSAPEFAAARIPGAQRQVLRAEWEARQKLWRWLIVGLLAAALVEILLAGWLARRVKTIEVTP